jgi:precorrin-6B methylase 2
VGQIAIMSQDKDIVNLKRIAQKLYKVGNPEGALSNLKNALDIAVEIGDEAQQETIKNQLAAIEKLERKGIKQRKWYRIRKLCSENKTRAKCKIYLAADVKTFRRFAAELPTKDDVVLELGCSTGKTTKILAKSAGTVFAIEKNKIADAARDNLNRFENVTIIHEDAQNIYQIFEKVGAVKIIFIDIGGNALPWQTVSLAQKYMKMLSPRILVMRNNELSEFISSLEYYEKWNTGKWYIQCKASEREA